MSKTVLAMVLGSFFFTMSACTLESTKPSGPRPSTTGGNGGESELPRTEESPTAPSPTGGGGSGGTCAEPTGVYDEERTVTSVVQPPGPDSPCQTGTYSDSVDFSQPPPLSELPGCEKTKDEWSADGCTHTVERRCDSRSETCVETLTFASDLSSYTGTKTCSGTFDGVDDSGPYTCKTTIKAKRKR